MISKKTDTVYVVVNEPKNMQAHANESYTTLGILGLLFLIVFILINLKSIKRIFNNIKPKNYKVEISGFSIEGNIQYTSISQDVSWKIYIELITRVSANKLEANTGILRETLASLYTVFGALRDILKNTSAELAKEPLSKERFSVTSLTLVIMNQQIRPFLSKWHPSLQEYELLKPTDISQFAHEQQWASKDSFIEELNNLQLGLNQYINMLKEIAAGKEKL